MTRTTIANILGERTAQCRCSDETKWLAANSPSPADLHRLRRCFRESYAALLQDLALAAARPIYLKIEELGPGAGDPLARIEMAVRRIAFQRRKRTTPMACFAFLDEDQAMRDRQRARLARRLAADNGITIVWQSPCFEAVLLRHLPDRSTHRPPDTPSALRALEREWPDYRKPLDRAALARRLDLDAVRRAASVEPELAQLLRVLGIVG